MLINDGACIQRASDSFDSVWLSTVDAKFLSFQLESFYLTDRRKLIVLVNLALFNCDFLK